MNLFVFCFLFFPCSSIYSAQFTASRAAYVSRICYANSARIFRLCKTVNLSVSTLSEWPISTDILAQTWETEIASFGCHE